MKVIALLYWMGGEDKGKVMWCLITAKMIGRRAHWAASSVSEMQFFADLLGPLS
ncbi:MAG: hypothetical protein J4G00_03140 [Actinomycetia bacterium]|nr:hypothetical protein [Actinomycetes bacterium]